MAQLSQLSQRSKATLLVLAVSFLILFGSLWESDAQQTPGGGGSGGVVYVSVAPSGSCAAGARIQQVVTGAGGTYTCQNIIAGVGTWTILSSGSASGTVTSVATGTGLTGGPISTTGTIAIQTTGGVSTNASFFPLFVSSNTSGSYALNTTSGLNFNPSTGNFATPGLTVATSLSLPSGSVTTGMIGTLASGSNGLGPLAVLASGGTLSGFTWSGGTFSGTIAGTPTLSGVWTFSSTQTLNTSGNAATATNISTSGTANQVWGMNSGGTAQGWQNQSGVTLGTSAQILVMNSGATAYVPQTVSGDGTLSNAGVLSITKANGNSIPSGVAANQLLVGTAASTFSFETVPDCHGSSNALNYTQSTFTFSCLSIATLSNPMTTLGDVIYGGASGAVTRLAGPTGVNSVPQILESVPSGGVATAPVWTVSGIVPNAQTGTTYTFLATDRNGYTTFSNASAIAVTLPQANSTGFASNYVTRACDIGAGTATITPTTSTISYTNGSSYTSGASSMPLTTGQCTTIFSDNTNYFANISVGGAALPSGTQGLAAVNTNGSTGYATSAFAGVDCSQFSGASLDVQLAKCNAAVITTNGGTMNARALGTGTLSAEVNIGQLEPPTLTAVAGGSLAAGAYVGTYSLQASAVTGSTSYSNESQIVTTSATCPGSGNCSIQFNSPTYPGYATTYKPALTPAAGLCTTTAVTESGNIATVTCSTLPSGISPGHTVWVRGTGITPTGYNTVGRSSPFLVTSVNSGANQFSYWNDTSGLGNATVQGYYTLDWSELDCGATTSVGSNATITSACTGAAVNTSNNGFAVDLILPTEGIWTCGMTSATYANGNACMKFHDQSSLHATFNQSPAFYVTPSSTAVLQYGWATDDNPKLGASYYNIDGMSFLDTSGATISVASSFINRVFDTSRFNIYSNARNNQVNVWARAVCCGSSLKGRFSSNTGLNLEISDGGGNFTVQDTSLVNGSTTQPTILITPRTNPVGNVHFAGTTYFELPSAYATDMIQDSEGFQVEGRTFDSIWVGAGTVSGTHYIANVGTASGRANFFINQTFTGPFTNILNWGPDTTKNPPAVAANSLAGRIGGDTQTGSYELTGKVFSAGLTVGVNGSAAANISLQGATSGSATLSASATGGTLNLGNTNATVTSAGALSATGINDSALSASLPVCSDASKNLSSTCTGLIPIGDVGSAGLSGTAPIAISAAGTISITGAAGQVLAGATPAFTATPSLGTDGSVAGTLQLANNAAAFHTIVGSAATANNTFLFPATVFTTGHLGYCVTSTTVCTWTDTGYAYNAIPLADLATQGANTLVANVTGSTAVPTAASIPSGIQNYVAGTGYNQATAHQVGAPLACSGSASTTAPTCTTSPSFTPASGDCIRVTWGATNTGALTLNVNSSSAAPVQKWFGTALASGDAPSGKTETACYDGTNWQVTTIGNAPSGGGGTTTNALTLSNNQANGAASGTTFNGASAVTLGLNTLLDPTTNAYLFDDFNCNNASSTVAGCDVWNVGGTGTVSTYTGTASPPGTSYWGADTCTTTATATNFCAIHQANFSFPTYSTFTGGVIKIRARLGATTNLNFFAGIVNVNSQYGELASGYAGVAYSLSASDTGWMCVVYDGTTKVRTAVSGTLDTNWHTFTITWTAAKTIQCQVDGGTATSMASTHFPTDTSETPEVSIDNNGTANAENFTIDYYLQNLVGLAR